jgi:hypothetical protein
MTFFENDRPVPKANKDLACGSAERMKPHDKDCIELTFDTILWRGAWNMQNTKNDIELRKWKQRKAIAQRLSKMCDNLTNKPDCDILYPQFGEQKK